MNEILKKRIEEAADEYQNLVIEETKCHHNHTMTYAQGYEDARLLVKPTFIDAADWLLQNQWISVDEALPEFEEDVLVMDADNDFFTTWRPEYSVGADEHGFVNYHESKITHWMPIPTVEGGEK